MDHPPTLGFSRSDCDDWKSLAIHGCESPRLVPLIRPKHSGRCIGNGIQLDHADTIGAFDVWHLLEDKKLFLRFSNRFNRIEIMHAIVALDDECSRQTA